ncbi:hypothetical protein ACOYR4_15320 [Acidovorax sp. M14]|uniref:hypothetical protein n=1 Tax=Acidovorax sp. M14 TaxID=3411354 RepID=UPI003BF5529D
MRKTAKVFLSLVGFTDAEAVQARFALSDVIPFEAVHHKEQVTLLIFPTTDSWDGRGYTGDAKNQIDVVLSYFEGLDPSKPNRAFNAIVLGANGESRQWMRGRFENPFNVRIGVLFDK